ncbi:hypothetical protein OH77DRAFT_1499521 [Trametes cingulata]|nr:hypothetical protein OH77DRAFT_1499521 [Trametes cingulata]
MHNLFLGELRHHCMDVWGIDIKDKASNKFPAHTPAEQKIWLNRLVGALRKGSMSAVMQPRKGYLVALAQLNGITCPSKLTKREYAKLLLEWVKSNAVDGLRVPPVLDKDTNDFHLSEGPHDISKYRVLTSDVMEQVRADLASTFLPSWIERPPRNFGSRAHGKLKADHWRTVCTIHMVITLGRIWGRDGASAGERLLLENFVHLVIAVDQATRRTMTPDRARLFDHHMLEYLRTLRALFDHQLVPNHHLSLHLASCLLLFGPVHGWWAFPFERFNGILQRLNNSSQIEKVPLSFMHLFTVGAELRWLMASVDWPDTAEFRELLDALEDAYRDAARGSRTVDIFSAVPGYGPPLQTLDEIYDNLKDSKLDLSVYATLLNLLHASTDSRDHAFTSLYDSIDANAPRLSPYARSIPRFESDRVLYGTREKNVRNSFVYFCNPLSDDPSAVVAGQIVQIFLHPRFTIDERRIVEPFCLIDQYVPLTAADAEKDPFRRFPLLDTRLYYNRFQEQQALVRACNIVAHFACLVYTPEKMAEECIVARSLDRVRYLTFMDIHTRFC